MQSYRCYFLDGANAIKDVAILNCEADGDVPRHARELLQDRTDFSGIEVWEGPRKVFYEMRGGGQHLNGFALARSLAAKTAGGG